MAPGGGHQVVCACPEWAADPPRRLDARLAGEAEERSIASQIEYWARLGRAADALLRTEQATRLEQRGEERPLSECLAWVDTEEGRQHTTAFLATGPFPRFEAAPGRPGYVVKIDQDGTRTVGRFVNRKFRASRPRR